MAECEWHSTLWLQKLDLQNDHSMYVIVLGANYWILKSVFFKGETVRMCDIMTVMTDKHRDWGQEVGLNNMPY